MKKILTVILCFVFMLSIASLITGCNGAKEYTSGDFTYKKIGRGNDIVAEITGLSEQGRKKKTVIVPETIGGLDIVAIRDSDAFVTWSGSEKWVTTQLTKVYLIKEISVRSGCWDRCPNLKQVFVINATRNNSFYTSASEFMFRDFYVFKDFYQLEVSSVINAEALNNLHTANVTYYFNYSGSANGGCYWLDQVDVGERIDFLPPEPTRQNANKEYKFGGWYTEKECINRWDFTADFIPESGEIALYAQWL